MEQLCNNSRDINENGYWKLSHTKSWISECHFLPECTVGIEKCPDFFGELSHSHSWVSEYDFLRLNTVAIENCPDMMCKAADMSDIFPTNNGKACNSEINKNVTIAQTDIDSTSAGNEHSTTSSSDMTTNIRTESFKSHTNRVNKPNELKLQRTN